ncbi:hypothetical protein Vadar_027268 [Vaccinium darrowii]|uniref:Uncharacterized protein n=1 Tax=Vaccinium darrowii TaxID=229202 RepID=A0ACB7YII4_9ERIC|nr:hypothetical protein Vadar_027268 [Vaccinium darrowii]
MYESWQILFGKDRATGELAEDPPEIESQFVDLDDISISIGTNECYTPRFANGKFVHVTQNFSDLGGGMQAGSPSTPTSHANTPMQPTVGGKTTRINPPAKKAKKMSRADAKQAALNDIIGSYMAENKEVMAELIHAIGFEQRLADKRNGVFPELQKLPIPMEDQFAANSLILATDERVIEFYSIPEQMRQVNVNDDIRASWTVFWVMFVASTAAVFRVVFEQFSGLTLLQFSG